MDFLSLGKTGRDSWWRYLLGVLALITVPNVLYFLLFEVVYSAFNKSDTAMEFLFESRVLFALLTLYLVIRFIHQRGFFTLVNPRLRLDWKRLSWGFGVFLALAVITRIPDYILLIRFYWFEPDSQMFRYLPLVLLFVLIKSAFGELFYRGYLLQGLGKLTGSFLVLSLINSALFLIPQLLQTDFKLIPYPLVLYYLIIGFLLSMVTLRSGSLEIAIGVRSAIDLSSYLVALVPFSINEGVLESLSTQNPVLHAVSLGIASAAFYLLLLRYLKKNPAEQEPEDEALLIE